MHSKSIEQWSVDEVAIWLLCVGVTEPKVIQYFRDNDMAGSDLLGLTIEELTANSSLMSLLNHVQAKQLLHARDFTKSVSSLEELAADMKVLELEKLGLEDQLVEKDEKIRKLEKQLEQQDPLHNDDDVRLVDAEEVLILEHQQHEERRLLEERQKETMDVEEKRVHDRRDIRAASERDPFSTETPAHVGKRQFKEQPYDTHRLF